MNNLNRDLLPINRLYISCELITKISLCIETAFFCLMHHNHSMANIWISKKNYLVMRLDSIDFDFEANKNN